MPFSSSETVNVDGMPKSVLEIERMQAHHCRVLTSVDGAVYLEYPVSVGPYNIEIPIIHVLSEEESKAWQAGNLDLGQLSDTLSEVAQITGKHERKDLPSSDEPAERRGLRALMHLVRMEINVLRKIGYAEDYSKKLESMVTEMLAANHSCDAASLATNVRQWAGLLSNIHCLLDARFPESCHFAEKDAIEKAIYDTATELYRLQISSGDVH